MSIYGTWLSIEDVRQERAELEAQGINFGVITEDGEVEDFDELPEDMLDAPIVYQGSHVLPSDDSRRGGSIDVAAIPSFITREGYDENGGLKDFLRLSISSEDSDTRRNEYPSGRELDEAYEKGGRAVVVLTRSQVERLRDTLSDWLEREEDEG